MSLENWESRENSSMTFTEQGKTFIDVGKLT